jgi:hypothetical protein
VKNKKIIIKTRDGEAVPISALADEQSELCSALSAKCVSVETIKGYYRVDRREIAFIKFIFEAYDGIAVLETLDPKAGIVVFHIAPGCERDVDAILQDLKREVVIEPAFIQNELACGKISSALQEEFVC